MANLDNVVKIRESYALTNVLVDASIENLQGFKAKAGTLDFRQKSADYSEILATLSVKRRQIVSKKRDAFAYQAMRFMAELETKPAHINWSGVVSAFENTALSNKLFDGDLSLYIELVIKEIFIDKLGMNINAVDQRGMTMLMHAVASPQSNVNDISMLIQLGADIDIASLYCGRAIHFVNCENDNAKAIFELLLHHGANPIEDLDYIPFQLFLNGKMDEPVHERISDFISVAHLLHDSSRRLLIKRQADDVLRVIAKYQVNHAMQDMVNKLEVYRRANRGGF